MLSTLAGDNFIRHPDRFFIGGEWRAPATDATLAVVTPSTEEVYLRVAEAQAEDMNRAVAAARHAFDHGPWRRLSHAERGNFVRRIAGRLRAERDAAAFAWTSEMGLPVEAAKGTLELPIVAYEQNADLADTFAFEERHTPRWGGSVALLVREPVGVVGAIVPWNAAPVMIAYKIAPALVAGCTVILKASPEAPLSAYHFAQICEDLGLPEGVVNVVTADREVSELLVRHPDVDKISFTGSSAAGKTIGAICGGRVARFTLELGGKSAGIVLDDYDLDLVADALGESAPSNTGQVCCSITRVVVSRHRHDRLVDALADRFRRVRVDDPFQPDCVMGPLATRKQRDRVENYIDIGKREGATLAAGGGRPAHLNRGYFIEPTIFGNVENSFRIAREEIFGPVLSVIPVDSEEEAITVANDTVFGLNNTVFTHDADRAYRFARELRSGTVGQNAMRADASIAFGGFKESGIGREGGAEGLRHYLETKTLVLDGAPSHVRG